MSGTFLLIVILLAASVPFVCRLLERYGLVTFTPRTRTSAASSAIASLQAILQPSVVHIVDVQRDRKQDEANGDPDHEPKPIYWR